MLYLNPIHKNTIVNTTTFFCREVKKIAILTSVVYNITYHKINDLP